MTEQPIKVDHYLDIYTKFYLSIIAGYKTHEIRKEKKDRIFRIGDVVQFKEIKEDESYTGESSFFQITWIDRIDIAGVYNFAILSIKKIELDK